MPAKNAEKHLAECLDSIIKQTYTNWELLVVNDNSTDSTEGILKEYIDKEFRIVYFNNNGNGIIDALKLAYKNSKGNCISRMDSDDIMPENKLELMQEALVKNPNSLVTGYIKYISDNELKAGYIYYQNWLNNLVDTNSHYKEIYKECVIPSPCWMVKKDIFEKCEAFNSETYPEDYDLTFRFYKNNISIISLKKELHIWRDHQERASRNDDNYSDNSFLDIKIKYFLKIDYNKNKTLVLWGASKRAKNTARLLQKNNIQFVWSCNNPNKINHKIYDVLMQDVDYTFKNENLYQTIITVANKNHQKNITDFLKNNLNIEAFWFC